VCLTLVLLGSKIIKRERVRLSAYGSSIGPTTHGSHTGVPAPASSSYMSLFWYGDATDLNDISLHDPEQDNLHTLDNPGDTGSLAHLVLPEGARQDPESLFEVQESQADKSCRRCAQGCVNSKICRHILAATVTVTLFGGVAAAWVYSKSIEAINPPSSSAGA